jgi:hypothetical protein
VNVTKSTDAATLTRVRVEAERRGDAARREASARMDAFLDGFSGVALSDGGRIGLDRDDLHDDCFYRFSMRELWLGARGKFHSPCVGVISSRDMRNRLRWDAQALESVRVYWAIETR